VRLRRSAGASAPRRPPSSSPSAPLAAAVDGARRCLDLLKTRLSRATVDTVLYMAFGVTLDDLGAVPDVRLPILVTGADLAGGLGIARALRHEGAPVYGLALNPGSPCCRSSSWTEILPVAADSEEGWLQALAEASVRHPRQALLISQDTVVEIVARNAARLQQHYTFVLPDPATVRILSDKTAFATWAQDHNFPIPRTRVARSPQELDAALRQLRFPVVLKPHTRDHRWHTANGSTKAHLLASPGEIADIPFPLFDVSDRYVMQEWIDGGDSDVHFCLVYRDRRGRELGYRTGRKLLQWPVGTGNTAICTTTDDPELHRLTRDLFDRAGLVGLGSLEVKRDRRDGRFYITEPTVGRPNLQSNVAAAAGRNLIAIAYRDACGLPIGPRPRPRQAIWLNESNLPPALLVSASRGQLDLVGLARAVLNCRGVMLAFAARGDRRPLVAMLATKARALLQKAVRRRPAANRAPRTARSSRPTRMR
jgi:D-aspartate ligase